ncbi:MAG: hypothetical protein E7078_01025 [Bacteroidales bacterium]|nr:hypothetical protein [Bacteroidales bacterium]
MLRSRPGGLGGSWPCRTYPAAKVLLFPKLTTNFHKNNLPQPITDWRTAIYNLFCSVGVYVVHACKNLGRPVTE